MNISLINPYELGRQPFGLAEPAAFLQAAGHTVRCCDLSIQKLDSCLDETTGIVAIYIAMHTATRIAVEALPKIRQLAPQASLCVYGLYAPMNADLFRSLGVGTVLGGEFETGLVSMAARIEAGTGRAQTEAETSLEKITFMAPDRSKLPPLSQYARLINPDGSEKTVGFAETTRGCKYLCRHCPVVPVYQGKFFVIPADIVLDDIRAQVQAGARHISFGDPDFFNGPGHALRIVRTLHQEFPASPTMRPSRSSTSSGTRKKSRYSRKPAACLFSLPWKPSMTPSWRYSTRVTAVKTLSMHLPFCAKLTSILRRPSSPLPRGQRSISTCNCLRTSSRWQLIESVAPVQLSIRLLIPAGSYILKLDNLDAIVGDFDAGILGHPWNNPDPRVDELQQQVQSLGHKGRIRGAVTPGHLSGNLATRPPAGRQARA